MLADLLHELSGWTWQFLRDAPFRPREETITESLLTEFVRRGRGDVLVRKSSIAEENDDGLDWAWAVRTNTGWITALVQAKNIGGHRFGIYPELRKASAGDQARNLIHAAALAQALPLYVFYNSEVSPFGPAGTDVAMRGCGHGRLVRDLTSLPWKCHCSPLGVTLAHASDVLDYSIGPPAANQRAFNVNAYAMPWECLVCPQWPADLDPRQEMPAIAAVATQLAACLASAGDRLVDRDRPPSPAWLSQEPPRWAGLLREGSDPSYEEDAPTVTFFVLVDVTQ